MKGFVNNLLDQNLGLLRAFASTRGILLNPGKATLRKTASPQAHRLVATAQLSSDFRVEQSGLGQEHDIGPQHQSRRRRTTSRPAFQYHAVAV
jgi:hypothetical protein